MWAHFEGKARTLEESIAYLAMLKWTDWKVQGITLHNTSAPTLAQWVESGPAHDARIRNLENYYENELGWHAGPHWFISRNHINWFSNPLLPGVHSRCWNATRFGIEMAGEYNTESFNDGDGAMVRDLALQWVAALNNRFGFKAEDITFHVECKRDNHDCPGKHVVKPDVIARVKQYMTGALPTPPIITPPAPPAPAPTPPAPEPTKPASTARPILFQVRGRMSTFGGPKDTGMGNNEGIALFTDAAHMQAHGADSLLIPGTHGALGHRLNPRMMYLACRWDTKTYPQLRDAVAWVSANGKTAKARPVDWGPNEHTGRVADLSPALADALGLVTNDLCSVVVYEDGK